MDTLPSPAQPRRPHGGPCELRSMIAENGRCEAGKQQDKRSDPGSGKLMGTRREASVTWFAPFVARSDQEKSAKAPDNGAFAKLRRESMVLAHDSTSPEVEPVTIPGCFPRPVPGRE